MQSRAAIRYAKAIFEIANEENFMNDVYNDMKRIKELSDGSDDFKNLLSNSQIDNSEKKKAILIVLEKNSQLTENLLNLLIVNKRLSIVDDIAISFIQLYNCLLYTSPSPRDFQVSRMPSSA